MPAAAVLDDLERQHLACGCTGDSTGRDVAGQSDREDGDGVGVGCEGRRSAIGRGNSGRGVTGPTSRRVPIRVLACT